MPRLVADVGSHPLRVNGVDPTGPAVGLPLLVGHRGRGKLEFTESTPERRVFFVGQELARKQEESKPEKGSVDGYECVIRQAV